MIISDSGVLLHIFVFYINILGVCINIGDLSLSFNNPNVIPFTNILLFNQLSRCV